MSPSQESRYLQKHFFKKRMAVLFSCLFIIPVILFLFINGYFPWAFFLVAAFLCLLNVFFWSFNKIRTEALQNLLLYAPSFREMDALVFQLLIRKKGDFSYQIMTRNSLFSPANETEDELVEKICQVFFSRMETDDFPEKVEEEYELVEGASPVWLRLHGRFFRKEDHSVVGNCFLVDISREKKLLLEYSKLRMNSEIANRAKNEFLANMGHELRTPLNGVLGMTEILLDTPLSGEQKEYTETIQISGEKLLLIINDILEFSKLETGKVVVQLREFNIRKSVKSVVDSFQPRAWKKGLRLFLEIQEDVPVLYTGDKDKISQILGYLMDNAVKFTKDGEIRILVRMDGDRLKIRVKDSGIGISVEDQKKIFEVFSQADSSLAREYGGTGLGLAITRNLVSMLGGNISVDSRKEIGSEFTVSFPLQRISAEGEQSGIMFLEPRQIKVLLAEDNEINRKVEKRLLESLGCEVLAFASGEEAVEKAKKESFELIFLDYFMTGINGIEAANRIRRQDKNRNTPLIMVSGDIIDTASSDISDCLVKPVSVTKLSDIVEKWCHRTTDDKDSSTILNIEYALKMVGSSDVLIPVLETFVEDTPEQLNDLFSFIKEGDCQKARAVVHSIKGSAATIGADEFFEGLMQLQFYLRAGDMTSADKMEISLKQKFSSLLSKINRYLTVSVKS